MVSRPAQQGTTASPHLDFALLITPDGGHQPVQGFYP